MATWFQISDHIPSLNTSQTRRHRQVLHDSQTSAQNLAPHKSGSFILSCMMPSKKNFSKIGTSKYPWSSDLESGTPFFNKIFITIAAQRSPRRGQEVDHVGVREASSSVTIHEFNSQFGRNPQANPIRFWTIRRPRNAEIDYIRSETSPFRLERQEPSTGRRHSIQGSIVRTLYSSNPNSSTPS